MKLWNIFISLSLFCLMNACVTDEENLANKQVSSPKLDIKKMGTMITRILDKHKEKGELLAYRACPPTKNYKAVEIKSVWKKPTAVIAFYHNNDHIEFKKSIGREGVQAKAKHSIDIITKKFQEKGIDFNKPILLTTTLELKTMKVINKPKSLEADVLNLTEANIKKKFTKCFSPQKNKQEKI